MSGADWPARCHLYLEMVGTDLESAERHEGQMTTDESFFGRGTSVSTST
jgi:hypothetical protein